MASSLRQLARNNENDTALAPAAAHSSRISPRKPLAQLSANAQRTPRASVPLDSKSMTGPPLKRSFNDAIDERGFTYLKKRRLSFASFDDAQSRELALSSIDERDKSSETLHLPHVVRDSSWSRHLADLDQSHNKPIHEPEDIRLQPRGHNSSRESSSERHSFSSLINYDPSSQNLPSSQAQAAAPPPAEINTLVDTPQLSSAQMLRMRLQVALYKVRTNQTAVPFDYLREDTANGSKESNKAVQEAVEELRREAQARLHLSTQFRLDDPPTISAVPITQVLPSPTRGRLDDDQHASSLAATPNFRLHKTTLSPGHSLTSSAVKGQVAEGLLGLKNGF